LETTAAVGTPAAASASASVVASSGIRSRLEYMPSSSGSRPVISAESEGAVNGAQAKAESKTTQSSAKRSRFGVVSRPQPYTPRRSARSVSQVIRNTRSAGGPSPSEESEQAQNAARRRSGARNCRRVVLSMNPSG
jgi:hypothetical protein